MKPTDAQLLDAIADTGGVLKNIAHALGMSLTDTQAAIGRSNAAQAAMQEEQLKLDSLIHERLVEQAQQGNVTAMRELERRHNKAARNAARRTR